MQEAKEKNQKNDEEDERNKRGKRFSLDAEITKRRKTPMQNYDEPFHFIACRYAGHEIARISCIAAGSN